MLRFASVLLSLAFALSLAGCSPKFDWREIRSAPGGFSVLMPDKPQTVSRDLGFDGTTIHMTMISTGVGPTLFAVGFAQLPAEAITPERLDATLAWFRDPVVRNIDGKITSVQPARLSPNAAAGHVVRGGQAIEARGHVGKDRRPGQLAARLHVVDDRIYEMVAIGADGELTADALETFFSSFRLVQ